MPQIQREIETSLSEINMVPFIDVVLVLLIIFMLTAPILQSGIEVNLPKTHTVKTVSTAKVVITIDKRQTLYIGNDPVNFNLLGETVLQRLHGSTTSPVYIRADRSVPYETIAEVLDALTQAKVPNISFVTEPITTK